MAEDMKTRKNKPTLFELFRQSMQDVEGGYDLLAPKFDQSRYITPDELLEPFFATLKKKYGHFDSGIDICCGTGAASKYLVQLCQKEFTALDLSQGMLDQCQQKVGSLNPTIRKIFVKANALSMPFDNQFDVAVSFGAFGHIREEDEPAFIDQIHRILKPGGRFVFITTGPLPFWSWSLWRQRIFNGIIRVRNWLIRPKFIMYYLTFRLPGVVGKLEAGGFKVRVLEAFDLGEEKERWSDLLPMKYFRMVVAEKVG